MSHRPSASASTSRLSQTENEIVENFLREQQSYNYNGSNGTSGDKNDDILGGGSGSGSGVGSSDDETTLTEDIRKMARALAPQISELEDVLKDFTDTETADALEEMTQSNSRSMMEDEDDDDDDDNLDDELTQLAMSEQALREELEFAAGISLLGTPTPSRNKNEQNYNNNNNNSNSNNNRNENENENNGSSAIDLPSPVVLNAQLEQQHEQRSSRVEDPPPIVLPSAYTLQDHADYLQLKTERTGRWYYSDMTSKLMPTVMSGSLFSMAVAEDLVKDYCLPIPFRKLKRLYGGLVFHDVWESKRQRAQQAETKTTISTPKRTPSKATTGTPVVHRLLQTPAAANTASSTTTPRAAVATPGGFTMPVPATPATPAPTTKTQSNTTTTTTDEKKNPPRTPLQHININNNNNNNNISNNNNNNVEEPLPVRTIAIRVRPDVLCGAIMDAAHHAFEVLPRNCTTHIIKRQGGHLRGAVYLPQKQIAYVADIQLCTQKNDDLERRLLLRYYHIQDDPDALLELGQILQRQQQQQPEVPPSPSSHIGTDIITSTTRTASTSTTSTISSSDENNNDVMAQERSIANRHLKQTCSLIQRLMAAEQQEGGIKKMDRKQQSRYVCVCVCVRLCVCLRVYDFTIFLHSSGNLNSYSWNLLFLYI